MAEGNAKRVNEREISLLDLLVEMLLHWRVIVVLMVIGGILMGSFSYVKSYRAAQAQKAQIAQMEKEMADKRAQMEADAKEGENAEEDIDLVDVDKQWLEEQLTEAQINNVKNALMYKQFYEDKVKYQQESILMAIDPFKVSEVELTLLITSDDMEKTYSIEKIYEDLISSAGLYDMLKEKYKLPATVSEIIMLEASSYGQIEGLDTLRLRIVYKDGETCREIADSVVEYLTEKHDSLEKIVGAHELTVVEDAYAESFDQNILTAQKNCATELSSLRSNVLNLQAAFTEDEWYYYNYLDTGKASENPDADKKEEAENTGATQPSTNESTEEAGEGKTEVVPNIGETIVPGISVKYIILGMILFAFFYAFVVFVMYVLNNRLRVTDSLQEIYNIPQLGVISGEGKKKRFLGVVDEWILSLRDRNKRKFTPEEATELMNVAVRMAAKKVDSDNVYVVGCNLKEQSLAVCNSIQVALQKENIRVKILDNVLYNAETMEELVNAGSAVLVETAGSTLYEEVGQELELLERMEVKVLGGIVVEQ